MIQKDILAVETLDYDEAGRVDSLLVTVDGSQLFGSELTHDLGGRVLTAAGASQSSTFTYDGFGHLTQSKLWLSGEQSREVRWQRWKTGSP